MKSLFDRRLTCNRIFRHLFHYQGKDFTGKIKVLNKEERSWDFYFLRGNLVWAYENNYALRRWRRNFYDATGQLPTLDHIDKNVELWDRQELQRFAEKHLLTPQQVQKMIEGILEEVLFDVVQVFEAPVYKHLPHTTTILPMSQLIGVGDGIELEVEKGFTSDPHFQLPGSFFPRLQELQKNTYQLWEQWVELGLVQESANNAPVLAQPEEFKSQVTEKVYRNMLKGLNGKNSLRDLAFKFKHGSNFLKLAQAIAPYYEQELIGFQTTKDLSATPKKQEHDPKATIIATQDETPLCLAIEPNLKCQRLLQKIAYSQSYSFQCFDNGFNALYEMTTNRQVKPSIIFVTHENQIIKSYEICQIIRRMNSLQKALIFVCFEKQISPKEVKEILIAGGNQVVDKKNLTPDYFTYLLLKEKKDTSSHSMSSAI